MQRYANRNSGVTGYDIGDDYIMVQFRGGALYVYTADRIGADRLETMKQLAVRGWGLNTYINTHSPVRDEFEQWMNRR